MSHEPEMKKKKQKQKHDDDKIIHCQELCCYSQLFSHRSGLFTFFFPCLGLIIIDRAWVAY